MYKVFSPQFIEACLTSDFKFGDEKPCPKCGHPEVVFNNPRRYLPWSAALAVSALVLGFFHATSAAIGAFMFAVLIAASAIVTEPSYTCMHCRYSWRFRDAVKWAKAIRRDHEAKSLHA